MIALCAVRIAKAPVHLRWELYPVPHEKGKAHYGGSRLEDYEWWKKPIKKDLMGEIKVMASEILFLSAVKKHNSKLWLGSYPFHLGLYLAIINSMLIAISAFFPSTSYILNPIILGVVWILGIFGTIGSALLLYKRIFDRKYSIYSTFSHYFNIILIGSVFVTALLWLTSANDYLGESLAFFRGLPHLEIQSNLSAIGTLHILIALFLVVYIPFTHMTHFFTKYFTYHKVRWDDEPNLPGSKLEKRLSHYLNMPVSWSAPHIGADGRKTWLAIAASDMPQKEKP